MNEQRQSVPVVLDLVMFRSWLSRWRSLVVRRLHMNAHLLGFCSIEQGENMRCLQMSIMRCLNHWKSFRFLPGLRPLPCLWISLFPVNR